jgi:hypothetical protein
LVKGVRILSPNEYNLTDNLFVVSTNSEANIRKDSASLMNGFRRGEMVHEEVLTGTDWRVDLFNRDRK